MSWTVGEIRGRSFDREDLRSAVEIATSARLSEVRAGDCALVLVVLVSHEHRSRCVLESSTISPVTDCLAIGMWLLGLIASAKVPQICEPLPARTDIISSTIEDLPLGASSTDGHIPRAPDLGRAAHLRYWPRRRPAEDARARRPPRSGLASSGV